MRFVRFLGMLPKISHRNLPRDKSVKAENMDVYSTKLRPIRLPLNAGIKLLTPCGQVFEGKPVTVHRAGTVYIAWDKQIHTAVDWTRKLGETTFLFVQGGTLYRQSAERVLKGECPIKVGICRPQEERIDVSTVSQAGCPPEQIIPDCVPVDYECDNVPHPPVPVAYLYTYVNACGEESAPSKPSEVVDMVWGDAIHVRVTDTPPENAVKRRWYRAVTDNEGVARWLLVAEIPIGQTEFYDTNCPCDFSEELSTSQHDCPPDCLEGVTVAGDNLTVVWSNAHFWISEYNFPHAYNWNNEFRLRYRIHGMYETPTLIEGDDHYHLLVITHGLHYAIKVESPEQCAISEIAQRYKVANPLSVTYGEDRLFYASHQGIVSLATNGEELLTGDIMTEHEWDKYKPHQVRMSYYDDMLFGFNKEGGFILQMGKDRRREGEWIEHTIADIDMAYSDEVTDMLLIKGNEMYHWDKGERAVYDWHSQTVVHSGLWRPVACKVVSYEFHNVVPRGFAEARRVFDDWVRKFPNADPLTFFVDNPEYRTHYGHLIGNRPSVTVIIYADGKEYFRKRVCSNKPFLLPRRYKAIDWSVRVIGSIEVDEVHLQSSRESLQGGD